MQKEKDYLYPCNEVLHNRDFEIVAAFLVFVILNNDIYL